MHICFQAESLQWKVLKRINFLWQVFATAALGAGILVGASAAYIITRIYEHTNLTHLVTRLHSSIKEVKEEITHLENGKVGLPLQKITYFNWIFRESNRIHARGLARC